MLRVVRILSVALITAGLVVIADVGLTMVWKEPVSAAYGSIKQGQANDELADVTDSYRGSPTVRRLSRAGASKRTGRRLAALFSRALEEGKAMGRIEIPSINADYVVVQGTDTSSLQEGPGHYPDTALPGQGRTIGIAGHRTTYLAPFKRINDIDKGDTITLKMPYGDFTYEVSEMEIVEPTETDIVDDIGREQLVLTACHPLYSAAQRYAIFAELEDFQLTSG